MTFIPTTPSDLFALQDRIHSYACESIAEVNWADLSAVFEYTAQSNVGDCGMAAHVAMPALACVAVGGDAEQAIPLAASWELYYWAAALLDDMIDRDHPTRLWHAWESGRTLNVGVGLLMAAQVCLSRLKAPPRCYRRYPWRYQPDAFANGKWPGASACTTITRSLL